MKRNGLLRKTLIVCLFAAVAAFADKPDDTPGNGPTCKEGHRKFTSTTETHMSPLRRQRDQMALSRL